MIKRHRFVPESSSRPQAGFTLLSVLVATLLLGIGLLAIARTMVNVTSNETQNQSVAAMAPLSNGFWGVVQANPQLLNSGMVGTYTASSEAVSSTPLQNWLAQTETQLPAASITIATYPDAGTGTACTVAAGANLTGTSCTVVLTLQWTQGASLAIASATRTQTFYYQF